MHELFINSNSYAIYLHTSLTTCGIIKNNPFTNGEKRGDTGYICIL